MRKDELIIEIDGNPLGFNPLNCSDYNGFFLSQFLFFNLKDGVNCDIVTDDYITYNIILYEYLVSKGINSVHYVNTIIYYYNGKGYYKCFAPFIRKVKGIPCIEIVNRQAFRIVLWFPFKEFKKILQSRYIIPSTEKCFPVNCGYYKLIEVNNNCIKLESREDYFKWSQIKLVNNTNPIVTKYLYENNKVDITCHSNFSPILESLIKANKVTNKGSLLLYIYIKDTVLADIFHLNKKYILENIKINFGQYLDIIDTFFIDEEFYSDVIIKPFIKTKNKKYKILYSNYFPNKEIANICKEFYLERGIEVELVEVQTLEQYFPIRKIFDMYIGVAYAKFNDYICYCLEYALKLNIEDKKKFVRALVERNFFNLHKLLENVNGYIPLALLKNSYYINDKAKDIKVSQFGEISFYES